MLHQCSRVLSKGHGREREQFLIQVFAKRIRVGMGGKTGNFCVCVFSCVSFAMAVTTRYCGLSVFMSLYRKDIWFL